jgi:hypothetical protein
MGQYFGVDLNHVLSRKLKILSGTLSPTELPLSLSIFFYNMPFGGTYWRK